MREEEETRTSTADRERYANHLPLLFEEGRISGEELDTMTDRVLQARTITELDRVLVGLPKPAQPRQPRDYSIPGNFLPVCAVTSLIGLTVAVVPTAALAGHHSALAGVATGMALCWGIWIVIVSVIAAITGTFSWDSLGSGEKLERRRRDQQGR
jgi:hypothetical protein